AGLLPVLAAEQQLMPERVDMDLWEQCVAAVPKQRIPPHALPLRGGDVDGNRVIFVNANELKLRPDKDAAPEHPHMDFVEGANEMEALWVRREFGKKVLIIDVADTGQQNAPFILYHEAHERRDMATGMSYHA